MSIFDKINKNLNVDGLAQQIKEAQENSGNFDGGEVPYGDHIVKIEKMECTVSKSGKPMFVAWFRIVEGDQANRLIFMNQLIEQGFQIGIVNDFMRSLDTEVEVVCPEVTPTFYDDYNQLVLDVHEACENLEFELRYAENKKGFKTYKILNVYDA